MNSNLTYSITVKNWGPSAATGVVFEALGRLPTVTAGGQAYVTNCYDGSARVASCAGVVNSAGGSYPAGRLTRRYGRNPLSTGQPAVTEDFRYSGLGGTTHRQDDVDLLGIDSLRLGEMALQPRRGWKKASDQ